jgi:hypothetical protein
MQTLSNVVLEGRDRKDRCTQSVNSRYAIKKNRIIIKWVRLGLAFSGMRRPGAFREGWSASLSLSPWAP